MPASFEFGIDFGTTNIIIYERDTGIVFDEPSAIAYTRDRKQVIAFGKEANDMIGRTPENIAAIRPLHRGDIYDFDMACQLLRLAVMKVMKKKALFTRPRVVLSLPINVHDKDKKDLVRTLFDVGMKKTQLIHKGVAASLGAGVSINRSRKLIVDISGGTTDIMIISNRIANSEHMEFSSTLLEKTICGDSFSKAIMDYFQNTFSFQISMETADKLKENFASLYANQLNTNIDVWGRNVLQNTIHARKISVSDLSSILIEPTNLLLKFIQTTLLNITPQESIDVQNNGIFLTGGGAMLQGLDAYIQNNLQLKTYVSNAPKYDTVLGIGYALENPQEVKDYLKFANTSFWN